MHNLFNRHKDRIKIYSILIGMVLLYMLVKGYSFYASDPYEYVPSIQKFIDNDYLKNDWFLNTQTGFNVRTYFYYLISFFLPVLSIKSTFLLLFIVNTFFLVLGIFYISQLLFKDRLSSYLSCFLVLFSVWKLIGDFAIIAPFFTPSHISITLSIWALFFFLRKRYNIMFLMLGLSTFLHLLIGISALILLSTVILVRDRFSSIKIFAVGSVFYSPALLSIIPLLLIEFSQRSSASEVILTFAWIRIPWHLIPSQFSLISYISFSILTLLFLYSLRDAGKSKMNHDIYLMLICAAIYFFLGYLLVEVFPIELAMKLQFFRMIILVRIILLIYIANHFSKSFASSPSVLLAITLASLFDHILIVIVPFYLIYELFIKKKFAGYTSTMSYACLASIGLTFFAFILFGKNFISSEFFRRIFSDYLWIFFILAVYYIHTLRKMKIYKLVIPSVAIAFCILSIAVIAQFKSLEPEKDNMYSWIRQNTPDDSVFLIPPYLEDFRVKAMRAIVVDFKSMPFQSDQMIEWRNRLSDITSNIEFRSAINRKNELKVGFESLTKEDIARLQDKYGFQYILIEKPMRLQQKSIYENAKYALYSTS